ncbi:MAG: YifB family Mg chelatase-like AAA ATPase [Clostridia bacterium]|nr:YifB family Mg chelatase-like AAA ATPase [Clostridia bacterium]
MGNEQSAVTVINSATVDGINGYIIKVEASHTLSEHQQFDIIGLPDAAVKESVGRVRAAARSSRMSVKVGVLTVNLAPAFIKKEGSGFDLPILLSVLSKPDLSSACLDDKCFIGELSLTGVLRPVRGALSMAIAAKENGIKEIFVPEENAMEAAASGMTVYPVGDVTSLIDHLLGKKLITPVEFSFDKFNTDAMTCTLDYCDVKGQELAKRAVEIAAAGYHNLLMLGPPGTGKSMIASRIPSIMPPLSVAEAIDTTKIHSVAGILPPNCSLVTERPFRSPHHTISPVGLAGGGKNPRPGEISLAHNGVLFLDELPEFDKRSMEILRQPIEQNIITITRANGTVTFPSDFMLVAAMNPCKCGFYGHSTKPCICSDASRKAYLSKISGPLLDRIDIHVRVGSLDFSHVSETKPSESSAEIRKRVLAAREFARKRFESMAEQGETPPLFNSRMTPSQVRRFCLVDDAGNAMLKNVFEKLAMSARGYNKILKLARTIADFDRSDDIKAPHIAQAVQFRTLDREI